MPKTYIIAEAGVNHQGSVACAIEMIAVAKAAGADAIKFQTFCAEQLVTADAPTAGYQAASGAGDKQLKMLKELELKAVDFATLKTHCYEQQIDFLSTPFDLSSVDLLSQLEMSRYKIASGEITNAPLLLKIARLKRPIILSTGMATLADIEFALSVIAYGFLDTSSAAPSPVDLLQAYREAMQQQLLTNMVTLLHCGSQYPLPYAEVNLNVLQTFAQAFQLSQGYSDHTNGIEIAIAAVALGATIIEKHFTLDKNLPGPDHRASLTPVELKQMITSIRHVESALGGPQKIPVAAEFANRAIVRKSLVATRPIAKGETLTPENLGLKRPGSGIAGNYYWEWLGRIVTRAYQTDDLICE